MVRQLQPQEGLVSRHVTDRDCGLESEQRQSMGGASGRGRGTHRAPRTSAGQHHSSALWQRRLSCWRFSLGHATADSIPVPEEPEIIESFVSEEKDLVMKARFALHTSARYACFVALVIALLYVCVASARYPIVDAIADRVALRTQQAGGLPLWQQKNLHNPPTQQAQEANLAQKVQAQEVS